MTGALWEVIEYLKEPALVAEVQQYFGVKLKKIKEDNKTEGISNRRSDSGKTMSTNSKLKNGLDFEIQNSFWFYLFTIGTALGDEIFYASFIPFWFWNIDGAVGRRVVCVWTISMYIGQGIKDILKWPRPVYPAKRLQTKWVEEHGMPSTHAVVGVCLPLSVIVFTKDRYIYSVPLGALFAFCWCSLICISRIYLGMHSVLDIVAGLTLALILMVPMAPLVDTLDMFWLTEFWAPVVILLLAVAALIYFPHSDHWTPTWGDTVMIISVCTGILIGSWANFQLGNLIPFPYPPPYAIIWPDIGMIAVGALRTFLGFALIFATRMICKAVMESLLCRMLNVQRDQIKSRLNRNTTIVELSSKFVTYFAIGLNIVFSIPALFRYLGIERPTFYTEI